MEKGEASGSNSDGYDIWAKLVPLNSSYSDIELKLDEQIICSNTKIPPCEKQEWGQITREKDKNSVSMKNKCSSSILVDGAVVREDETVTITCGSEIILGPEADGFVKYVFKVMPAIEPCKKQLKVTLDPEHAKCPICLNVWHDVVTAAPCLHNFCNGCFSKWLKRCEDQHSSVVCPLCRAVVQFVGRNHFLHGIEEDILLSDSSLRRSDEELAILDSCSSIKSPHGQLATSRAVLTSSTSLADASRIQQDLRQEIEREISRQLDELRQGVDRQLEELRQETSQQRQETSQLRQETSRLREELRQGIGRLREELRQETRSSISYLCTAVSSLIDVFKKREEKRQKEEEERARKEEAERRFREEELKRIVEISQCIEDVSRKRARTVEAETR